jgi:fermentation-respiration switch protein FrsA (DUF1100 family)
MKQRPGIVRAAVLLGLCLGVVVLMLRIFEGRMVYYPARVLDAKPGQLGRPFEEVFIPVENGEQIHAWYFPAHPGQVQASDHAVLVCHGNAGNISHRLDLAQVLLEAGGSVLLFDYRGYGLSSGKPGEEGTYRDAQAAWRWLAQKGFAGTNIVAYGESLGGGVATELAVREPLGGLILQSTFTSIPDLGAELFPWLPVRLVGSIKYDNLHKLPRLKIPILILHSRQDRLIAFHHGERNFAAANQPKYFCEINGDHNDALYASRPLFLGAIKDFLHSLAIKPVRS